MKDIYSLLYHLKSCPELFLKKWDTSLGEKPQTEILVKDIYRRVYGCFNVSDIELPAINNIWGLEENHLLSMQVGCWFFSLPLFNNTPSLLLNIHFFLFDDLCEVSKIVNHRHWVEDDDRAEEFIRLALRSCEIIPDGETATQALDKLEALDSLKRQEVLKQSGESLERIREIRRKMAEEKAREAANVYGRE